MPGEILPVQPFFPIYRHLTYNYRYEYKKISQHLNYGFSQDINLEVFVSYNGKKKPDPEDFNSISVKHESPDFNYIIGNINLAN